MRERQLNNWFTEARNKQKEETGVPIKTRHYSQTAVDYLKNMFAKNSSNPTAEEDTTTPATGLSKDQVI